MARTILKERSVLVLGIECAPGRAAAQQMSRAGCKVLLGSTSAQKVENLADQLERKGGTPMEVPLPSNIADWTDVFRIAREGVGHIHMVVNALAFCYRNPGDAEKATKDAQEADRILIEAGKGRGPLKMLTLWPEEFPVPTPAEGVWQGFIVMGPRQRMDNEQVDEMDAVKGMLHLRAGGVGDAVAFLLQLPPSVRPSIVKLEQVPSSEKKAEG